VPGASTTDNWVLPPSLLRQELAVPLPIAVSASQGAGGPPAVSPLTGQPQITPEDGSRKRIDKRTPGTRSGTA